MICISRLHTVTSRNFSQHTGGINLLLLAAFVDFKKSFVNVTVEPLKMRYLFPLVWLFRFSLPLVVSFFSFIEDTGFIL